MLDDLLKKQFYFNYIFYSYYQFEKKINNNIFRKYFIVDTRDMSDREIINIFSDFDLFNEKLLKDDFLSGFGKANFDYSKNTMLLFLYNNKSKHITDNIEILYNMEYGFKKFVTENELADIISEESIYIDYDIPMCMTIDGNELELGFNLLYGLNGSGKTKLLYDFYNQFHCKVPMFNMYNHELNLIDLINDKNLLEMYLKRLNEFDRYDIKSNTGDYLYRLSQILAFSKERNNIVFLDDMCWGSLDDRNQINVIDTLFEYSCDNPVAVTSCQSNIKKLIKSRVYHPNIIEL